VRYNVEPGNDKYKLLDGLMYYWCHGWV